MKITVGQYQDALKLIKRYKRQLKDEAKEVNVIEVINNHKESEIIKKYIKEICKYYGFGLTDFISKRRYGNYIKGKQLLCYLLKEYDNKVFKEEVVSEFVLLHRTTVIYHVNTVKNYIESKDKETLKAIGTIKYQLNN